MTNQESPPADSVRFEHDSLGGREVPADAYWGISTMRASRISPLAGAPSAACVPCYGATVP